MVVNETFDRYVDGWSEMMVNIWKDKIRQLKIRDTGALFQSVSEAGISKSGSIQIKHNFLEYGFYVDAGTGNGYKRKNGGDLGFTPSRQPRPWFNKKHYSSFMTLRDAVVNILGHEAMERVTRNFK